MYVASKSIYSMDEDVIVGKKLRTSLEPLFKVCNIYYIISIDVCTIIIMVIIIVHD